MPGKGQKMISAFEARLLQSKKFKSPISKREKVQNSSDNQTVVVKNASKSTEKQRNLKNDNPSAICNKNKNKSPKKKSPKKTESENLPKLYDYFQKAEDVGNNGSEPMNTETASDQVKIKKKKKKKSVNGKGKKTPSADNAPETPPSKKKKKNKKKMDHEEAPSSSEISGSASQKDDGCPVDDQDKVVCSDLPLLRSKTSPKERKRKTSLPAEKETNASEVKKPKLESASPNLSEQAMTVSTDLGGVENGCDDTDYQELTGPDLADVINSKKSAAVALADGSVLLNLAHPQEIPLKGCVRVSCLVGTINIMGYNINAASDHVEVFSPDCYSLVTMVTKQGVPNPRHVLSDLRTKHRDVFEQNNSLMDDLSKDLAKISQGKSNCPIVILRLSKIETSLCKFIGSFKQHTQTFRSQGDKSNVNKKLLALGVVIPQDLPAPPTVVPNKLHHVMNEWGTTVIKQERPVMMVCGGKGSGKSTTNRLLLNTALNVKEGVYYLECDVGQPEFTPTGVISLVHVTQPVLGPPFCHQRTPVCAYYYGGVSPKDNPDRYLQYVGLCMEHYRQDGLKQPLIVNTMGWLKDLGWQLLLDTVNITSPTNIVQLTSADRYQNVAPITLDKLQMDERWSQLSKCTVIRNLRSLKLSSQVKIRSLDEVLTPEHDFRLDSKDYRNLGVLSHLGANIEPGLSLHALRPYTVQWDKLGIAVLDSKVPWSQIMYLLNASLVGLCVTDITLSERPFPVGPLFVPQSSVFQWKGFGIVRGIDTVERLFYIVTSLTLDQLSEVNCLVKSGVVLPEHLLTQQNAMRLPYADKVVSTAGIHCKRPRRRMGRAAKPNRQGFT